MEIVPALLESSQEEFEKKLDKLATFAKRIQVDFNDGSFEGFTSLKSVEINKYAQEIFFEAHLMVQEPLEYLSSLYGFKKVIVQYEIGSNVREVLEEIKANRVLAGLAIGPETSVFEIEPYVDLLDTITVMDIKPGKQGQKFLPAELEKIRELKAGNFPGEVQADGGIDENNIQEVLETGADTAVVGSFVAGADSPIEKYSELLRLVA